MGKQVAIIGAGISGLLACKYTLSKGFQPIVFEASSSIGGVWTKTVETTRIQSPKDYYQFSDFPWPSSVTEGFPTQNQVLDYIKSYAQHFDLLKHIKFNTKVCGIEYEGPSSEDEMQPWSLWGGNGEPFSSEGKWKVVAEDKHSLSTEIHLVDFVILCLGRFSDVPNIPDFHPNKGPEAFHGGVELPCTVIYKTEHWNLPDYLPWGLPLAYLYFSRFSELLVHKPGEGLLLSLLATILSPLRWAFSKFVESHVNKKLGLAKYGMVPKHSFLQEISSCMIATVPEKFFDRVQEGSIILKKSPSSTFSFCQEGILVEGESSPVKTDLVIMATGFRGEKKLKDVFVSPTFQDLIVGSPETILPLYRECIHGRIPQLAVIGFSESISNLFTSEMRCRWLSELLAGTFKLPSIKEMEKDVEKWDKYAKRYASGQYYRRSCIGALHLWYNDQLCKDMGWNHKRKKGVFAELFEPYGPMDYVTS